MNLAYPEAESSTKTRLPDETGIGVEANYDDTEHGVAWLRITVART